jgi:hypothetical protein
MKTPMQNQQARSANHRAIGQGGAMRSLFIFHSRTFGDDLVGDIESFAPRSARYCFRSK